MGKIANVQPVKLFIGILSTRPDIFLKVQEILSNKYGALDKQTSLWPFEFTDYYAQEMGSPLLRQFITFQSLIDPKMLKDIKLYTNQLEEALVNIYAPPSRPINLDPGYLSLSQVVLATTKPYSHRIYLGDGIYAEVTLRYQYKSFTAWEWTYPDYQSSLYLSFFQEVRKLYQQQLRSTFFTEKIVQ